MPEETNKKEERLSKALDALFTHEEQQELLRRAIKTRPEELRGPSHGTSYFKESFALQILPDIQAIMADNIVLEYDIKNYPDWRFRTLVLYINQALDYICKRMDPDGKIKEFRKGIVIRQKTALGKVYITHKILKPKAPAKRLSVDEYLEAFGEDISASPDVEKAEEDTWKNELFEWMENAAAGDVFERNVKVSKELETDLVALLDADENFFLKIADDNCSIYIRKIGGKE